jgi:hypothetical protein
LRGLKARVSITSMWLWTRLQFLRELSKQPFLRLLIFLWAASGIWDLALSQWIPEKYSSHLPRVYQIVALTTGILSWQIWIVVGPIILAIACLEYAFRRNGSKIIPSVQGAADQSDIGETDLRYNFVRPTYTIMFFGLLVVILSAKILYDRGATEIHHPVVTYLPENDVLVARIVTPSHLPPPQLQLISTAFHEVFKCQYHWPVPATPKERAEGLAKIKAASKTMESVFGVSIKILTTDDSVGMELTPVDPSNIRVFGPMVKKLTEVVRYLNDDYVIITVTYDAPGLLGQIFSLMPPPDIPGARDQQRKFAATLLQIDDDKCELL